MPARTSICRPSISVEEYLRTSYRPDCDYMDGEVVERTLGECDHRRLQGRLLAYVARYEKDARIAVPEQCVQVEPERFRIPNVWVALGEPGKKALPPFFNLEIVSPDDGLSQVVTRMQNYLELGVAHLWILDPETKQAYTFTTGNPQTELPLAESLS